jgi:altronate dehydratase large subunit
MFYQGYQRGNGLYGTRNRVLVLSSVVCANAVAEAIAREVSGVLAITHDHGCGGTAEIAMRVLPNIGINPNYAAVLVVGLGCEGAAPEEITARIAASGKETACLVIQKEGGSASTAVKGTAIARRMLAGAEKERRVKVALCNLTVGLKCGGSDAFSGLTANPALGVAADLLVKEGARVIVSEITETVGVTHILKRKARDEAVSRKIDAYSQIGVAANRWSQRRFGTSKKGNSSSVSPGNVEGGITNIVEKSLGCIAKWGNSPINDCVPYAVRPEATGLVFMESDGYDLEALTGMAAGGAQVMVFTTGRGNSVGFTGVPVIKVSSNSGIYRAMTGDIDVNAGAIIEGTETIGQVGRRIFEFIIKVAGGGLTCAEVNRQELFAIRQEGFLYPSLREISRKCL